MEFEALYNKTTSRVTTNSHAEAAAKFASKFLKGHKGVASVTKTGGTSDNAIHDFEAVAKDGTKAIFAVYKV